MTRFLPQPTFGLISNYAVLLVVFCLLAMASCQSVKPYQRVYLDDPNMQPGKSPCEALDDNVFSYREGGLVTGGSKTKGGCGCN